MPSFNTPDDVGLQFHMLTGQEFEDACYGKRSREGLRVLEAPWLLPPKVKYFHDRSVLERGPDTRVFFMATRRTTLRSKAGWREAVAVLEIAAQPYTENTVGIKYISVLEAFRGNGLAMQLYGMLVEFLHAKDYRLYRTRPGAATPAKFTEAVTRLLDQQRVSWYRHELSEAC